MLNAIVSAIAADPPRLVGSARITTTHRQNLPSLWSRDAR